MNEDTPVGVHNVIEGYESDILTFVTDQINVDIDRTVGVGEFEILRNMKFAPNRSVFVVNSNSSSRE